VKRLILFDIDGTLISTRGAAKRAFERAMLEVYGTTGPIATHDFSGKTDP
jgi:beta-phosphoglucomutase-like phosphatase (HAD superfamily)